MKVGDFLDAADALRAPERLLSSLIGAPGLLFISFRDEISDAALGKVESALHHVVDDRENLKRFARMLLDLRRAGDAVRAISIGEEK